MHCSHEKAVAVIFETILQLLRSPRLNMYIPSSPRPNPNPLPLFTQPQTTKRRHPTILPILLDIIQRLCVEEASKRRSTEYISSGLRPFTLKVPTIIHLSIASFRAFGSGFTLRLNSTLTHADLYIIPVWLVLICT